MIKRISSLLRSKNIKLQNGGSEMAAKNGYLSHLQRDYGVLNMTFKLGS